MKKTKRIADITLFFFGALYAPFALGAINSKPNNNPVVNKITGYTYESFNSAKYGLSKAAFAFAMQGYNRLAENGALRNKRYLTICDMSLSSKQKRFFVMDLVKQKIIYHLRVAHGQGSGEEYATRFSNVENSHQTSLGFYTTGNTYEGENGISLQLKGHEKGINNNAANRAVVMHGSNYVDDDYYKANKRIGRSWGCPAIPTKYIKTVSNLIKNGSCLFIYHPNKSYIKNSVFVD